MFDRLFGRSRTTQRYFAAPLLDERLRYLCHCASAGAARKTLRRTAWLQLAVMKAMGLRATGAIRPEQIRVAADRWITREPRFHARKNSAASRVSFISTATRWLRFLDRLAERRLAEPAGARLIGDFAAYMRHERGLSPVTIYTRCKRIEEFFGRFCTDGRGLRDLNLRRLDEAIAQKGTQDRCTRASIRTYAYILRSFLRYAEMRNWCTPGLAAGLLVPRVYTSEQVPAGPSWDQVQRLCATADGDRPAQIRDRALLLLFAVYGLRVGEVRRLRLEDFDWRVETIRITRSKPQTRIQAYPLSRAVGDAILRYLKEARPTCAYRDLFLSLKAPIRPLGNSACWQIVSRRLGPMGLPLRHNGPHALRHACAAHLLQQGLSMKEIGDHLGHRNPASTSVYAKVDMVGLRRVADFPLEGLV